MILITDSGSTKTNWSIAQNGLSIQSAHTPGINPYFQSQTEIENLIGEILIPQLSINPKELKAIYFYGAGCAFDKIEIVKSALTNYFPIDSIEVNSDLLGAARAICGKEAGIACIMGTGSNSCFYDGKQIVKNISPLGFILGDEGSGAALGKLLVGDLLKEMLPITLKEKFLSQFNLTPAQIIENVYRKPFPNRFLASLSPFIAENIQEPAIYQLALNSFKSFIDRNVKKYDYQNYTTNFVGSIAHYYKEILKEAATQTGIQLGNIEQSPINGLITYHMTELHNIQN